MREGKKVKADALKNSQTGEKKRDEKVARDAKTMLCGMVKEQWCLLLLGAPFMFLGSTIDFLAPNYIGRVLNQFNEEDFEAVKNVVIEWICVSIFSAACSAIREAIFGVASQKLGKSLRKRFFVSLLNKDINFFDNNRSGEMLSRLGSDTEVVQDGLTTNVAMFVKATCICIGCIVIVALYDGWLCLVVIGGVLP